MTRLSPSDLEATIAFMREAAAVTGPDPFPSQLLDRLRELVRCNWAVYEERDLRSGSLVGYGICARGSEFEASRPAEELDLAYGRLKHQSPLGAHRARTGDLTAHKLSDFVTRREWHRLELYAECFRFYGVEARLQFGLPGPPSRKKTFLFDRGGDRDFDERDRLVLNLLQPHLTALDAAARERRLAAALRLDPEGSALVVFESSDQIDFATPAAELLLTGHFGSTSDDALPDPIRAWLHDDSRRLNGNSLPPPSSAPLHVARGDRRLVIRRSGNTLLLTEELATLTRREREIVDALAEGRSNAEIADRLTIAPTTVRKHLENIYAKLGVRTRTAAVARVKAH